MAVRNIICIVVDGLRASSLGTYGNTWFETPALNQLASDALVMDLCYADSLELGGFYRSVWHGQHAAHRGSIQPEQRSLPALLRERGYECVLMTDESALVDESLIGDFDECLKLPAASTTAPSMAATTLANLFSTAADRVADWPAPSAATRPQLLWIHARGLAAAWDAPYDVRQRFCEEGDPQPPDWLVPPTVQLTADTDPDELFGLRSAHAAQVVALDHSLQILLDVVADRQLASDACIALAAPRGTALAEHGSVGVEPGSLYVECLHIPLLLAYPETWGQSLRSRALVQPPDLAASLLEWADGVTGPFQWHAGVGLRPLVRGDHGPDREQLLSIAPSGDRSIVTREWFLRATAAAIGGGQGGESPSAAETELSGQLELYSKPDDYWEANELADRCPEEAAELLSRLRELR